MKKLFVIGIGTGNPNHMTVQGIEALQRADVVLVLDKGAEKSDLTDLRKEIVTRFCEDNPPRWVEAESPKRDASAGYKHGVDDWHGAKAAAFSRLVREDVGEDETAALLVWGDPSLYDSTLRILDRMRDEEGLAFEHAVIPGVSSLHALAAAHRIPLNEIGEAVLITTGRKLAERFPPDGTIVVMLDGGAGLDALEGRDCRIWWGAYLGSEDEVLMSGPVPKVLAEIKRLRAACRDRKGWIMDIYLIRQGAAAQSRDRGLL
ncbi:precorrin 6A synthase [Methyloligella halotolerans]|uniref:Precorrin-6A synthase [deacetylating] n=1 Tax=Methyloligella halotolerans TaxID=1177755 RepID=A0A1E2S1R5_9HYPH|nr:precorrin-6A synthase (deacetylating) [Methyloligella halotolerans]ODA68279.1 precorrin 6A synthase [Methyloligella halotolerans]